MARYVSVNCLNAFDWVPGLDSPLRRKIIDGDE
jgi:hypothetical protein